MSKRSYDKFVDKEDINSENINSLVKKLCKVSIKENNIKSDIIHIDIEKIKQEQLLSKKIFYTNMLNKLVYHEQITSKNYIFLISLLDDKDVIKILDIYKSNYKNKKNYI